MDAKQGVQSLFDELSATYDSTGIDFFGQIARELVARARLTEGSTVLDVGCGAGAALLAASGIVGPTGRVIGIDLAEGMVARARRAAQEARLENVEVRVGDAEAPALAERSIDAIISSLVVFFLPDIDGALDEYARTLRLGGIVAFSTFAGEDDWSPLDEILEGFAPPSPPSEVEPWFQSPEGIRSTLGAHGFTSVSIDDVTHDVDFPSLAAFHEWSWSTGSRAAWSAIPAEHREEARAAVDGYLDSVRERRGTLRLETAIRYTRATAAS